MSEIPPVASVGVDRDLTGRDARARNAAETLFAASLIYVVAVGACLSRHEPLEEALVVSVFSAAAELLIVLLLWAVRRHIFVRGLRLAMVRWVLAAASIPCLAISLAAFWR